MAAVNVTRNWFLATTATRAWRAPNEAWGRSHLYFDNNCQGVDAGFNVMDSMGAVFVIAIVFVSH